MNREKSHSRWGQVIQFYLELPQEPLGAEFKGTLLAPFCAKYLLSMARSDVLKGKGPICIDESAELNQRLVGLVF